MTTWRENADRLRKWTMDVITKGVKEKMKGFDAELWHQVGDTMPKPDRGYLNEISFTCPDADYAVKLSRCESAQLLSFTDLRACDPEFKAAYEEFLLREDMAPLAQYLKSDRPLRPKEREKL